MTDPAVHFDAVLHPHRSLSRKGFLIVMIMVGAISFAGGMVFLLIAALGLLMALVYVPVRLFLTITARSRRLRLLQKIRRLRDDLGQPLVAPQP